MLGHALASLAAGLWSWKTAYLDTEMPQMAHAVYALPCLLAVGATAVLTQRMCLQVPGDAGGLRAHDAHAGSGGAAGGGVTATKGGLPDATCEVPCQLALS